MMIEDSVGPLFINKAYTLRIIDNFYANTMNYSRQQSNTERFLYFINRHNAEFEIPIGTQTVQLRNRIGVKRNDIIIHEDDNLIDLQIDTDTSSFCTAIKGYYRFREPGGDNTEKVPTRTYDYISPMASKYKIHWGEPVYDERFEDLESIKEACRLKQESTWKTSFTLDAKRFKTPLNEGDEVRLIYPSKSINMFIRVVEIDEHFDAEGELIGATYTFGNENISAQYRKMQYDAIQDVRDIMNGKKPIPYSVLPAAVRQATEVIDAGSNTQFYYRNNEIYGVNLDNPLGITRYNANGIGFSRDGGQTYNNAITYLGVVTEALTAGTIDANRITIYGADGNKRVEVNGERIKLWDVSNPDAYVEITPENGLRIAGGKMQVDRDDGGIPTIIAGKMRFIERLPGTDPAFVHPDVEIVDHRYTHFQQYYRTMNAIMFEHTRRYFRVSFTAYTSANSPGFDLRLLGFGEQGEYTLFDKRYSLPFIDPTYEVVYIDLGPPTGYRIQFYIQTASRVAGEFVQYTGNTYGQTDFRDWELLRNARNE